MTGKQRFVGRAPGRLQLMGGNGNYTGGLVFEATTAEGIWATVELREDNSIVFLHPRASELGWAEEVEFSLADLIDDERVRQLVGRSPDSHWTAHGLGAFFLLKEWFPDQITRGANIYIKSEIPMRDGAGSSAALEVAVMKTAAHAYGVELAGIELAAACEWVESIIAESPCGIADQIAVVLGVPGSLLPVLCQPCTPYPLVPLPPELELWGVNSGSAGDTGAERDAARVAAFMAYKLICDWEGLAVEPDKEVQIPRSIDRRWNGYLSNIQPSLFRSNYEQRLPEWLTGAEYLRDGQTHVDPFTAIRPEVTYRVRACGRYAVEENHRTRLFVDLVRAASGFETMGELMYQAHYASTECGLGSEAADHIVSLVCEEGVSNGLFGAKISGGADDTVVVLGRRDAEGALQHVVRRYAEKHGASPRVFGGSSMGADQFGVLTLED